MCQTQVADSGERMKAGPGKSSICCRAGAYRLNCVRNECDKYLPSKAILSSNG